MFNWIFRNRSKEREGGMRFGMLRADARQVHSLAMAQSSAPIVVTVQKP